MDVRNDAAFKAYKEATDTRDICELDWQRLLAKHEEADARFLGGEPSAYEEKLQIQLGLAARREPLEHARRSTHRAWADWAHAHHTTTNELLAEIRDLLTKMANPPIMVSLDSTPESRAANLIKRIEAIAASDPVFAEAKPVNDGSEAADERDRALGRKTRQAMLEHACLYLHLLRRVIEATRLTVETCPAAYSDVADFLREEAGRT